MNIQEISWTGIQVGLGVALIPAAVTTLIACSKIIAVDIIADTFVGILTGNSVSVDYGVSFIAVPSLWKFSLISAITGVVIIALSLLAAVIDTAYHRYTTAR